MVRHTMRVLLIEDNPGDARLIREMLRDAGDGNFELTAVSDLTAGLEKLQEGGFGVVLLDLSLPDSFGLDTFRSLRSQVPGVAIVVLTGLDDETLAIQAVQEGAQDYLNKGSVTDTQLVHALRYALGRHQRQQRVEAALRASEEEMRIARQIQQRLFPAAAPACPGFEIHGTCIPAWATGGDFFDYLSMHDGRLGIAIGDVTSHGVGPALLMASTRAYLRALTRTHRDIGTTLALTNRLLADDLSDGRNVTLLLAELDPAARTLQHTSAGHTPGYILDAAGRQRARLYSTGLPLGIFTEGDYQATNTETLYPGDIVFLMTDGIVEARAPTGEMFGPERVLDVVRRHRTGSAVEIVKAICQEVRRFSQDRPQDDDMTTIVIKVTG